MVRCDDCDKGGQEHTNPPPLSECAMHDQCALLPEYTASEVVRVLRAWGSEVAVHLTPA